MDVCQSIVAALEPVRMTQMVEAQQMKQGGVQIMDMDRIGDDVKSELVGLSVDVSGLDPAPGQPDAEASVVMVATVVATLHHRSPTEFAAPDHERIFE